MATDQTSATVDASAAFAMLDMKSKLSTLWIFYLFNVIFRDIHEFFRQGFLEEIMTGTINGNVMTEELLFSAAFVVEIPILMVVLSRFLPYRYDRWVNIVVAIITIAFALAIGAGDLDDRFFMMVEIATLVFIIWLAWRWRK